LFQPVEAYLLAAPDNSLCFIEMAQASGLHLLKREEYNCAETTSFGTGQMIAEAVALGCKKIILGIGGSATNDCGMGMAAALGYKFLDSNDKDLQPIGRNLIHVHKIDASHKLALDGTEIQIACDVTNYLTGDAGATKMYGPQKGADHQMLEDLETGMIHFASVLKRDLGVDVTTIKGGGAAGGIGAGGVAFLDANLVGGAELIFQISKAEEQIVQADLVITGEGRIDDQTLQGKLVFAVAELCRKHNKPLIAVCGTLQIGLDQLKQCGITAAFSIINKPMDLDEAFAHAKSLLEDTSYNLAQLLLAQH
jgi:glycerate kinase